MPLAAPAPEDCPVKLTAVELRRAMPLVAPFRTSFDTQTSREALIIRVVTPEAEGWGECSALAGPVYSAEYVDGAADVMRRFFAPALAAVPDLDAYAVGRVLSRFKGHWMAKSALRPPS